MACPLAVFWDYENCPIPRCARAADVAQNIRESVGQYPIKAFTAYGDIDNYASNDTRELLTRTGVRLVDILNDKKVKGMTDHAVIGDLLMFALDNSPPASILIITGDLDYSITLHRLHDRGYNIYLAIPDHCNPTLLKCAKKVWFWSEMASMGRGAKRLSGEEMIKSLKIGKDLTAKRARISDQSMAGMGRGAQWLSGEEMVKSPSVKDETAKRSRISDQSITNLAALVLKNVD